MLKKETTFGRIFWAAFTATFAAAGVGGVFYGIAHHDGPAVAVSAATAAFFSYVLLRKLQSFS